MFVLGIDPGLSTTGYGVIGSESGKLTAVTAGVIRTNPDDHVSQRLLELADDLAAVVQEYEPAEAAIEEVFVNRNVQTAMAVGRASGVIIATIARAGVPVAEYTPSAVKLAVTANGDADKRQVEAMVARRLGIDSVPRPADAADALAVAICHAQSSRVMAMSGRRR